MITGTGTGTEGLRRLMLQVPGLQADGRDVYLATFCATLRERGRRLIKRVPGTGSGGWMYAGTGTNRKQVWDFGECYEVAGTGSGIGWPWSVTNPDGYLDHECCPNRQMPGVLYARVDLIDGPCDRWDGVKFKMNWTTGLSGVIAISCGGGTFTQGYIPDRDAPLRASATMCCVSNPSSPFVDCWQVHWALSQSWSGPGPWAACVYYIGAPGIGDETVDETVWGSFTYFCPAADPDGCETPFSVCRYLVVYPNDSLAGLGQQSCCDPAEGPSLYRLMIYEGGGQDQCGGEGPDEWTFTGTGTGTNAHVGTGTSVVPLGPWSSGQRRNRTMMRKTAVTSGGKTVWLKACCETGTGTGSPTDVVPQEGVCCFGEAPPEELSCTIIGLAGCGLPDPVSVTITSGASGSHPTDWNGAFGPDSDGRMWVAQLWCDQGTFYTQVYREPSANDAIPACFSAIANVTVHACSPFDAEQGAFSVDANCPNCPNAPLSITFFP